MRYNIENVSPNIPIGRWDIKDTNIPIRGKDWQSDFKNMIHVYAVHKKLIKSNDIGRLVVKRQKRLIMQILLKREQCLSDII